MDETLNRFSIPSNAPPSKALVNPTSKKSLFGIIPLSIGMNNDWVPLSVVAIKSAYRGPGYASGPALNITLVEFLPPVPTDKVTAGHVGSQPCQGVGFPSDNVLLNLAVISDGR